MKGMTGGFTLVEALIALLILSFGLLGVGAMQLKAMQSAHVSYQRSMATVIASDANERLWVALGDSSDGTCPSASSIQSAWREHWTGTLPGVSESKIERSDCEYKITVNWDDDRFANEAAVSSLIYLARLPGASSP